MSHRAYRGRAWLDVRLAVLERDDWVCQICGERIVRHYPPGSHDDAGTADHIVPVLAGGAWHDLANLRAAHVSCNRNRANVTRHAQRTRYRSPRAW